MKIGGFMTKLIEIGAGSLHMDGSGQGMEIYENDPVALQNKPSHIRDGFDTYHLSRYDGTNFVQWYGRRSDGRFYPHGNIMEIVDET